MHFTCNETDCDIIQQIHFQMDLNLLSQSSSLDSSADETHSSIEGHVSRKPQIIRFSSDDESEYKEALIGIPAACTGL